MKAESFPVDRAGGVGFVSTTRASLTDVAHDDEEHLIHPRITDRSVLCRIHDSSSRMIVSTSIPAGA
jgi:hypothetical protein